MKNLLRLILAFCFVQTGCSDPGVHEQVASNVLFIAVDDLKPMLGCYGDTLIKTPNIDCLASRGTVFLNNHCQQAVCGPSRVSLLTGLYPDSSRTWEFTSMREPHPDIITLPQHFRNNGYTTVNLGKIFDYRTVDRYSDSISWTRVFPVDEADYLPHYSKETGPCVTYHFQSPIVKAHFERYSEEAKALGVNPVRYSLDRICPATECLDVPDDAYKDGIFAKLGVEELKGLAKGTQPFFLAVGFHRPHLPFIAPKKYWDLYEREDIALPPIMRMAENPVPYTYKVGGHINSYTDETGNKVYEPLRKGEVLPEEEQRKLIHGYMAAVSYVDAQVGKLIDALEKTGKMDQTVIILWGDHGYHLGDHNQWGKSTNFEQSTRSPMIISAPGIGNNSVKSATEFIDIYPTLCELTGLDLPDHMQGKSLVDILQRADENESFAISQFQRDEKMGYAIRDDRYRYVEWTTEGYHQNPDADLTLVSDIQLFDYETDPWETVNLANDPRYSETRKRLADRLHSFYVKQNLVGAGRFDD